MLPRRAQDKWLDPGSHPLNSLDHYQEAGRGSKCASLEVPSAVFPECCSHTQPGKGSWSSPLKASSNCSTIFFFNPLISWWAVGLLPNLGYCQWTSGCTYSFELVFWVSLDIFPEVKSLGHKAVPFLIFWGISILFSTVAAPVCVPTNSAQGFPFLRLLASIHCWFTVTAILTGRRWPGEYYAKWNKPVRERQTPSDFTCLWNLMNKNN